MDTTLDTTQECYWYTKNVSLIDTMDLKDTTDLKDTRDLKDTTKMVFTIDTTQEVKTGGLFHLMTPQIYCIYLRLKV